MGNLEIGMVASPISWEHWPLARTLLDPALAQSDESWPETEAELLSGEMQLWAVLERNTPIAVAVTRIAQTKRGEVAEIYLCGGQKHEAWVEPLTSTIAKSASEIGCVAVRCYGRKGWAKSLIPLDWKMKAVSFERSLNG